MRGLEGIKAFTVTAGDLTIRIAVANGLANADKLIAKVESGEEQFDFIEVMACPNGCIGGGGQPPACNKRKAERAEAIFKADEACALRIPQQNPRPGLCLRHPAPGPRPRAAAHPLPGPRPAQLTRRKAKPGKPHLTRKRGMEGPFHARFFVLLSRGAAPAALMTLFPVRDCVPWPSPRGEGWKSTVSRLGDGAFVFFARVLLLFRCGGCLPGRGVVADRYVVEIPDEQAAEVDELPEIRLGRDGAALALKLSGAERVRPVEELRQILDRVTVEVVNGLLDAEFFDLV